MINSYGGQDIPAQIRRRDEALRDIYWPMKKTLSGIENLSLTLAEYEDLSGNVPNRERVPWWTFSQLYTLVVTHTVNLTEQMTLSLMSLPALRKLCLTIQTYSVDSTLFDSFLPSPMATPRSGGFPSLHSLEISASLEDLSIFFSTTGTIQSLTRLAFFETPDTRPPEDDPAAALTAIASALGPALDQLDFFLTRDFRSLPLSAGLVLDALRVGAAQSLPVSAFQLAGCALGDADLHRLVAPAPLFPALVTATFQHSRDDNSHDRSRPPPGFHHPTVATVHAVSRALPQLDDLQLPSLDPAGLRFAHPGVASSEGASPALAPTGLHTLRLAALEAAADVDVAPLAAALVAAFPHLIAQKLPLSHNRGPGDRLQDLVACVTALQQGK
ncbi:uncharacterized protein BXZ73DRAFT_83035 [Epithele typhae]|uniref:uncharacterized protein n=1 Tax=Epithele typhae TaxID=378194 RepID=UPI002008D148|nr:uncharacterized protein BXZ73DRAFT_83035 [Epithele typhae]KAH9910995.1 hypothetical protein BXZ73DRAFT_83035 [Epithele typhae]